MNKLYTLIYSVLIFTCLSCQQQTPQTQIEQTAIDFCEAFYNFNYTVAKEWSTPSSQSYLSFLASNVGQTHLEQLKTRGAAKVSVRFIGRIDSFHTSVKTQNKEIQIQAET